MAYDLDRIIDRKGSGSSKWELYRGGSHAGPIIPINSNLQSDGPIPMWVADMDFSSPQTEDFGEVPWKHNINP